MGLSSLRIGKVAPRFTPIWSASSSLLWSSEQYTIKPCTFQKKRTETSDGPMTVPLSVSQCRQQCGCRCWFLPADSTQNLFPRMGVQDRILSENFMLRAPEDSSFIRCPRAMGMLRAPEYSNFIQYSFDQRSPQPLSIQKFGFL